MKSRYADHLSSRHLSKDEEREITNQVADKYQLHGPSRKLLHGIRKIENGKQGREFGVLNSRAERYANDPDPVKSFKLQAEWAAGTIKNHFNGDLESFAEKYAPTKGATNDVHHLNVNWLENMQKHMQGSDTNDGFSGN